MPEPPKQNNRIDPVVAEQQSPPTVSPLVKIFASGFYSGYAPVASGTIGSLVGVGVYLIPGFAEPIALIPAIVAVFILGSLAAGRMENVHGHDPSAVTIDEVLGMWISLAFLPKTVIVIAAAFVMFRIFDILKPWPARFFDRLHGGWNIMLDDAVAGLYTNLLLQIVVRLV